MADETLVKLREEIDIIDNEIVAAFAKRQETVLKIGKYKKDNNSPVVASNREQEVIDRLKTKVDDRFKDDIDDLYKTIFDLSKRLQNKEK